MNGRKRRLSLFAAALELNHMMDAGIKAAHKQKSR